MKKILFVSMSFFLLVAGFAIAAQAQRLAGSAPPISQNLVREGEFAIQLSERLNLGSGMTEAEAESALSSAGVAPRNGWIADYPITPDIVGELEAALGAAADSQKLAIGREEALGALQSLTAEMGLAITGDSRAELVSNEAPPEDYGQYPPEVVPEVVNDYYYNEGPPVVTYYPPPSDFSYMYAWVPYPFWSSGFWFPGYFVLHDFHRPVFVHGRRWFISNHFHHPGSHRLGIIDPVTRHVREGYGRQVDEGRRQGFWSQEARRGAASIFERSHNRANGRPPASTQSGRASFRGAPAESRGPVRPNSGFVQRSNSRNRNADMPPTGGRRGEGQFRAPAGRTFQPRGIERGGGFSRSYPGGNAGVKSFSASIGRQFSSPSARSHAGSFASPPPSSRSSSRSFSGAPQGRQNGTLGSGRFFQGR